MKFLLAFLLCMAPLAAVAQCAPASVKDVRVGKAGGDLWAYWWCVDNFSVSYQWRGAIMSQITPEAIVGAKAYASGLNPDFIKTLPVITATDPSMSHLIAGVQAAVKLDTGKPLTPAWVVAKNGVYTTRPTRSLTNGVLGPSTERVAVGSGCFCLEARKIEGTTTYCAAGIAVIPNVAVCSKSL